MDDEQRPVVQLVDVWALCDALHNRLEMLGEVSPGFKDGYLVAAQHLADMVAEIEDELERARHDETMLVVTTSDDNSSDGT